MQRSQSTSSCACLSYRHRGGGAKPRSSIWRLVFRWGIWKLLSPYWSKCFFTMIMVLLVLFLDAAREVHKYSSPESMHEAQVNANLLDHLHLKLFRAQRNLYISGFSLFLWLVTRRVVALLKQTAVAVENNAGLQAQTESAARAADRHQEDNRALKQALLAEDQAVAEENRQLKLETQNLSTQLKTAKEAVHKSRAEVQAMARQTRGFEKEYERLLKEHHGLQNLSDADKKVQ
ncbi:B-cell receptor-associated protein 29-like isoform X2 [Nerophis ophidion]|uniref:B-cell receptor-associated protein 29-like isoform X2 n=1 Tax=Nerophis ophidion TaxID=159077 RepID=UPI002AE0A03A|nr:B-cell receptor-associated protein 29-like isoform X2 [Nerophis ophidion]